MTVAGRVNADIPVWREASGKALVSIGAVGSVLTIVDGWSNVVPAADWMAWAIDGFSQAMTSLFNFAASPLGHVISKSGSATLSFLLFYLVLTTGSLLLGRSESGDVPRMHNFMRLLIASYIVWPTIFLFSFAMRRATFTDKSFTMIVFLCSIALCHILINSLVRIDVEILGLILLYLMANLGALDQIRDAIYGLSFIAGGGYLRAILEIFLTLSIVMALLFPAVLAPGPVFRKSIGTIVLAAAVLLGMSAAWEFDYSKLRPGDFSTCCEWRFPWEPAKGDRPPPQ
jgi:hypothetical protein